MIDRPSWAAMLLALALFASAAQAQEVVYYEENGVTYRETRQTIRCSVPETKVQKSEQTVYRPQWKTETRDVVRTYLVPITEYRWEAYWQGRFNPFVQPYLAQRLVPHTRWETRSETVKVSTPVYSLAPEKNVVRTPVTTWKTVERVVTARVPLPGRIVNRPTTNTSAAASGAQATAPQAIAIADSSRPIGSNQLVGGVARFDSDPPRHGGQLGWHAPTVMTLR